MALLLALSDSINFSDPTVIGGIIVGVITIVAVGRFLFASSGDQSQQSAKRDNVVGKGKEGARLSVNSRGDFYFIGNQSAGHDDFSHFSSIFSFL
jgi:uncharacterized sodium:solute symporter family permease YidK